MEDYPFSEKTRIIWKQFIRQFQEESIASYQSDFLEFTRFTKKDFLDIHAEDVAGFYRNLEKKIEEKTLAPSTCAKKIRELNSLSNYVYENRLEFGIRDDYTNHFADYVKKVQKVSMYANAVPVEDIWTRAACSCTGKSYGVLYHNFALPHGLFLDRDH